MNNFSINAESINASEDSFIQRVITGLIARVYILANATIYRKNVFQSIATSENETMFGRVFKRDVIQALGEYVAVNNARIVPQTLVNLQVTLTAAVFIAIRSGVKKRERINNIATTLFNYIGTVYKRNITIQVAEAFALPEVSVFREIPWDEPAPADRTFKVPKGEHVFYVKV